MIPRGRETKATKRVENPYRNPREREKERERQGERKRESIVLRAIHLRAVAASLAEVGRKPRSVHGKRDTVERGSRGRTREEACVIQIVRHNYY